MDTSIKFIKIEQLNLNKVKESTRVDITLELSA